MKLFYAFLVFVFFLLAPALPAHTASVPLSGNGPTPIENIYKKITSLKIKDIQRLTGKKITLKEKVGFLLLKHKIKRQQKKEETKDLGQKAFTFGIIAVALFIAGLFIPFVILGSLVAAIIAVVAGSTAKKKDPSNRKAHAGKLMGWITLGLITLFLILAVAVVIAFANAW